MIHAFQSIQKILAVLGITPSQSIQKNPFDGNVLKVLFLHLLGCALFCIHFFVVANNFQECIISVYMTSVAVVSTLNYTILVCQSLKLFKFIGSVTSHIKESK